MNISFLERFPRTAHHFIAGKPTCFVDKIMACHDPELAKNYKPKKHTIRVSERIFQGKKLHLWVGGRFAKNRRQFNKGIEALQWCKSEQKIEILWLLQGHPSPLIVVDGRNITEPMHKTLAENDGFDSLEEFYAYFNTDTIGKLIHWTDLKY